ncbi:hypothetical protein GCM10011348_01690 [Marinobacterium nitratireducens]|uniref:Uncharacterized protein n=1 Tax=Marinobacterium nitratireducens TaxID=518897 RepID=A0A917Z665_9GAMM|nr:DUF6586 family protein [Marinobacterium nitratireducens]GGO75871.1 hypothetical protein GCM10011348_01690 [Marinobacterium nitratireducens]
MSLYITRTSQKLNFARLHLERLEEAQASTGWSKHALVESFQESVLFHLASGYQAFLREIAERYRLDAAQVGCFADLDARLEAAGLESPERSELGVLEGNADSWLKQMLLAYEACWQASERSAPQVPPQHSLSEIQVRQVNPSHREDGAVLEECRRWFSQFSHLVERLRAGMEEW